MVRCRQLPGQRDRQDVRLAPKASKQFVLAHSGFRVPDVPSCERPWLRGWACLAGPFGALDPSVRTNLVGNLNDPADLCLALHPSAATGRHGQKGEKRNPLSRHASSLAQVDQAGPLRTYRGQPRADTGPDARLRRRCLPGLALTPVTGEKRPFRPRRGRYPVPCAADSPSADPCFRSRRTPVWLRRHPGVSLLPPARHPKGWGRGRGAGDAAPRHRGLPRAFPGSRLASEPRSGESDAIRCSGGRCLSVTLPRAAGHSVGGTAADLPAVANRLRVAASRRR
jgi:hypothetical protein